MNTQYLKDLGLSEREISVYISLLGLGYTTTGALIKKSRVPGSKIYNTLDKLSEKGLVHHKLISKTKYFKASDPKILLTLLDDKKSNLKEILPELISLQKKSEDIQGAEVYESMKGVSAAYNHMLDSLNKGDEYLVFALRGELEQEKLKDFFLRFHQRRIKKGVVVRLIAHKDVSSLVKKYDLMDIKFTSLEIPSGIAIYKNKIITFVWSNNNPTAFVITSKQNTEQYKRFFEEMWKKARK